MPLPLGLTLNRATGVVSGIPAVSGIFAVKLRVKDASGARTEVTTSISIADYTAMAFVNTIGRVQIGAIYSASVGRTGGTPSYTYAVISGALPTGLSINAATGLITGTPTVGGTFNATVRATDFIGQTANCALVFVVANYPVVTGTAPAGAAGFFYTALFAATGGVPAYTASVSSGALPPGTALYSNPAEPSEIVLQGTCYTPGTYLFKVRATDSAGKFGDSAQQTVLIS